MPKPLHIAVAAALLLAPGTPPPAEAARAAARDQQLDRIQLHRSGNRGQSYLPRARADGRREPARFDLRATRVIRLSGNGRENVDANLYPIDVNGDRQLEFVQFNGSRFVRAFAQSGRKLWEVRNPSGRTHRDHVHRDTAAIGNFTGGRDQEIIHCWVDRGKKYLVVRRGKDGRVLRRVALGGQSARSECQIAAYKVPGRRTPLVLVAHDNPSCTRKTLDNWAKVVAFDGGSLRRLWQRSTCDAGHYSWPLDENNDGRAEAIFVGKYLLTPNGRLRCTLEGFRRDHVDSMVVADLDARRRGLEAVAVGLSGTRTYRAGSCDLIANVRGVRNGQHVAAARLSASGPPTVMVRARGQGGRQKPIVYRVSVDGRVLSSYRDGNPRAQTPAINANLDGAARREDFVTWFGQVVDASGRLRLDTSWYWNRQRLTRKERRMSPYDQWTSAPVIVDLNGDGRDEMITWGRRAIVIGSRGR